MGTNISSVHFTPAQIGDETKMCPKLPHPSEDIFEIMKYSLLSASQQTKRFLFCQAKINQVLSLYCSVLFFS